MAAESGIALCRFDVGSSMALVSEPEGTLSETSEEQLHSVSILVLVEIS